MMRWQALLPSEPSSSAAASADGAADDDASAAAAADAALEAAPEVLRALEKAMTALERSHLAAQYADVPRDALPPAAAAELEAALAMTPEHLQLAKARFRCVFHFVWAAARKVGCWPKQQAIISGTAHCINKLHCLASRTIRPLPRRHFQDVAVEENPATHHQIWTSL